MTQPRKAALTYDSYGTPEDEPQSKVKVKLLESLQSVNKQQCVRSKMVSFFPPPPSQRHT
jgi:hypothetical protein